jgi:hypothetical protein
LGCQKDRSEQDRRTVTKLHYHLLTGLKPASKNGQGPLPLLFL